MASRMATLYGLQVAQMNEELALESSLNLALMQHLCDENLESHRCALILKLIPFKLGIISFLQTLIP
jgi:hypothetical protein